MLSQYDNNQEFEQFVEDIGRLNYEKEEGALYKYKKACNNLPYEQLPDLIKQEIRNLVRVSLCSFNGIDPRLTSSENNLFWKKSDETIPSDEIVFETSQDYDKISHFWMGPNYKQRGTPADLIFNKTVPITDIVLNFKEFGRDDNDEWVGISFRVFLYEDYREIVDKVKSSKGRIAIIGGIIPFFKFPTKKNNKQKNPKIAYPICIGSETDFLIVINIAYKNCLKEEVKQFPMYDLHAWNMLVLNAFYGCQLSLLNPITEKVFIKAKKQSTDERKVVLPNNNKKRKIMYVKRYYIREKDLTKTIEDYRTHNIKCPLWWVIGHHRHYKSGKVIWVSGYWKGSERDKVKTLNETNTEQLRQRLLDMRQISE